MSKSITITIAPILTVILACLTASCKTDANSVKLKDDFAHRRTAENIEYMMFLLNTRDKYMSDITDRAQRARVLPVRLARSKTSDKERERLNDEYFRCLDEIAKIIRTAQFNAVSLLKSNDGREIRLAVKLDPFGPVIHIHLSPLKPVFFRGNTNTADGVKTQFGKVAITDRNAMAAIRMADRALHEISFERAKGGAWYNRLEYARNVAPELWAVTRRLYRFPARAGGLHHILLPQKIQHGINPMAGLLRFRIMHRASRCECSIAFSSLWAPLPCGWLPAISPERSRQS